MAVADPPVPGEGESLVRVESVGICGSDIHWYAEGAIGDRVLDEAVVPCHEIGGTVVSGPDRGRVVALDPAISCGRCTSCHEGKHNLCGSIRFAGDGTAPGGLAELVTWPSDLLFPMPEGMTAEQAALVEPLGVAVYAATLVPVRIGSPVAVVGLGPIGLLMCRLARLAGASAVIGVDPLEHRRVAALGPGRADVVLSAEEATDAGTWTEVAPGGCPVVYEASGSPGALHESLVAVSPDGDVALAGIPDGNLTQFPADLARRKGIRLTLVRRMRDSYPQALRLLASGRLSLDGLVSHRFELDRSDEAFSVAAERSGLKVVLEPQR